MKKIKIGIPRTIINSKNGVFLKNFLLYLGIKLIISSDTNQKTIQIGENNLYKSNCLQSKIMFGQIQELISSCDYILIFKNCLYNKKCIDYEIYLNNIKRHLSDTELILFDNEHTFIESIKIGLKLKKMPLKTIYCYLLAKDKQNKHKINSENYQRHKINSKNKKVLFISNPHSINDKYLTSSIIEYLKEHNITIITPNNLKEKEALLSSKHIKKNITIESKKILGGAVYYQYCVKGIIFLLTGNCKMDKYLIEIIKEDVKNIPIIDIEVDKIDKIETKLEILIDIISKRR